jgi:anti-anti-sigma factor
MAATTLFLGRTNTGSRLRLVGRGTLRESEEVQEFIAQSLDRDPAATLVLDLRDCDYLDSTFLGCLLGLHRRYGAEDPPRLAIAAPHEKEVRLLRPTRLDGLLNIIAEGPEIVGGEVPVDLAVSEPAGLGRHVMECHRRLAELGGDKEQIFRSIADRLDKELGREDVAFP